MTQVTLTREQRRAQHALQSVNQVRERLTNAGSNEKEQKKARKFHDEYKSYAESLPANIVMNGLGQACAIPIGPVKLEVDVMTPHYADYYGSGDVPGDWLSPVPIPFLAVAAGTAFQFGIVPRTTDGKEHLETVAEWLTNALQWLGAGAKTAVGYGRFEVGKLEIDPPSHTPASAKLPRYKNGNVVSVTRAEDPKPKSGKPRIWFVADDGFGGVVTDGIPPDIEIGVSTRLEVAAVMQHGGYNFRVPKGSPQVRK
jgi:CRISPR type III-B/RAMP module RAMP protein Cmr6